MADANFGNKLSIISFDVSVSADARPGDYSLRLQSLTGEVAYVVGALTIDTAETSADAGFDPLITPIDSADTSVNELSTGG